MNFHNMTPEQAANEITRMNAWSKPGEYDLGRWIAEACQHFHERGKRDAYKHAAEMALANDDFDEYYEWITEQSR